MGSGVGSGSVCFILQVGEIWLGEWGFSEVRKKLKIIENGWCATTFKSLGPRDGD